MLNNNSSLLTLLNLTRFKKIFCCVPGYRFGEGWYKLRKHCVMIIKSHSEKLTQSKKEI